MTQVLAWGCLREPAKGRGKTLGIKRKLQSEPKERHSVGPRTFLVRDLQHQEQTAGISEKKKPQKTRNTNIMINIWLNYLLCPFLSSPTLNSPSILGPRGVREHEEIRREKRNKWKRMEKKLITPPFLTPGFLLELAQSGSFPGGQIIYSSLLFKFHRKMKCPPD